jgi:hypothetical protein
VARSLAQVLGWDTHRNEAKGQVEARQVMVAAIMHRLVHSSMEVVRNVLGSTRKAESAARSHTRIAIELMFKVLSACESCAQAAAVELPDGEMLLRCNQLCLAIRQWAGKGLQREGTRKGLIYMALAALDQCQNGPTRVIAPDTVRLITELQSVCKQSIKKLDDKENERRDRKIEMLLEKGDRAAAARLIGGPPLCRQAPLPSQFCNTINALHSEVDQAGAALRRDAAGCKRPPHPLCVSQTCLPHPILQQEKPPTSEDIAQALGVELREVDYITEAFIEHLRNRGPHGHFHLAAHMRTLMRTTTLEEIQRVSAGWQTKAVGASGFRIKLIFCLPTAHQLLFLRLVNILVASGLSLTSLGTVVLTLLPKPDGGTRGLALVEDVMKLIVAIYMSRLSEIQRGLQGRVSF